MNSSRPSAAPPAGTALRLCLIRHGETEWNVARRIQGHTDIALNARGLRQAAAVAGHLAALARHGGMRFAAVYSSDLVRARDTAAEIAAALDLPLHALPQLRERNYGAIEGMTYDEVRIADPETHAALAERRPDYFPPGGGESLAQAFTRGSDFLAALPGRHSGGGSVVVAVAHGGIIDLINRCVRRRPLEVPRDFPIPNAALNWLALAPDGNPGWRIERWAETGHLPEGTRDELRGSVPTHQVHAVKPKTL